MALPPSEAVSDPPAFLVGAHVHVKPDTRPGIGPEHSVAAYGTIADVKAEGGCHYRIKSVHDGRGGPWVPEERYSHLSFCFSTAPFPLPVICYRLLNLVLIFIHLISYLFTHLFFVYLFIYLFVCLFDCLLFVYLFISFYYT